MRQTKKVLVILNHTLSTFIGGEGGDLKKKHFLPTILEWVIRGQKINKIIHKKWLYVNIIHDMKSYMHFIAQSVSCG